MFQKVPVVVLIGGGSKLPAIIKASKKPKSTFKLSLVVTHKKVSPGIEVALRNKIPAVFFNLVDFRNRQSKDINKSRQEYSKLLGWFVSQQAYSPKLLVFAGWDLILDHNFFDFFKSPLGDGYSAINIHPAIMPTEKEGKYIPLPDGTKTILIKGEQQEVLQAVLAKKLTYFGPSVHFMNPKKFDTGKVVERSFIKVGNAKNVEDLKKKLMPVEDEILVSSINKICSKIK